MGTNGAGRVRHFVEVIEGMHDERKAIGDTIAEQYDLAKSEGLNVKALKVVIQRRRKDQQELALIDDDVQAYLEALEKFDDDQPSRARARGGHQGDEARP